MNYRLIQGDCIEVMRTLPAGSAQCCVTSPPYLNLRSYLPDGHPDKHKEIGAEQSVAEYIGKLVEVFREVRRLLHPSGVLFLNLGDSYNGSGGAGGDYAEGGLKEGQPRYRGSRMAGLKPKDLCMVPARAAIALQEDGWWLRQEIVWHKKAPMPESVQDRCTRAHEMVYMLAKNAMYFYDAEAIREPFAREWWNDGSVAGYRNGSAKQQDSRGAGVSSKAFNGNAISSSGANRRSVWTLGPENFNGAHFATMPTKLVEPCILAGTSAHGCCSACGAPWERVVERTNESNWQERRQHGADSGSLHSGHNASHGNGITHTLPSLETVTLGWQSTCTCNAAVMPCTVLDPFFGSGTVGAVALKHGRHFVGIDIDERNVELAHRRIEQSQPMLLEVNL